MFLHLKCRVRHFFKKLLHFGLFKNLLKTVHLTELYLRKKLQKHKRTIKSKIKTIKIKQS